MSGLGIDMWCKLDKRNILVGSSLKGLFTVWRGKRWDDSSLAVFWSGCCTWSFYSCLAISLWMTSIHGGRKSYERQPGDCLTQCCMINAHVVCVVFSITWSENLPVAGGEWEGIRAVPGYSCHPGTIPALHRSVSCRMQTGF